VKKYLLLLLCVMCSWNEAVIAAEKQLLVFVSDRSSGNLVASAHRFLQQERNVKLNIRTVSQLNQLSNQSLQALVDKADALLLAAVFGEPVERLLNLNYPARQTRLAINGDRRLLALHADPNSNFETGLFEALTAQQKSRLFKRLTDNQQGSYQQQLTEQQQIWPQFAFWLQIRAYWQNRNDENRIALFESLLNPKVAVQPIHEAKALRIILNAEQSVSIDKQQQLVAELRASATPMVFIIDHDTGDRPGDWQLHQALCSSLRQQHNTQCISVLSAWGAASVDAVEMIQEVSEVVELPFAIVSLQDFVVGGGDGRETVTELFQAMNVPVFKGIRLTELNPAMYGLSSQGLPNNSVHYRIAMPELQGIGQAHVLALAAAESTDLLTGAQVSKTEPVKEEVQRLTQRVKKWFVLNQKDNSEKRIAIVFYNHPPGRHNIGADNLNVPDSLWEMLQALKKAGYDLGPDNNFPKTAEALLDRLQQQAVNLPEDAAALAAMSQRIYNMSASDYSQWFSSLPEAVQSEMVQGPLGFMHQKIDFFMQRDGLSYLKTLTIPERQQVLQELYELMDSTMHDLHHALDGIRHKGRERALNLLDQLEGLYVKLIDAKKVDVEQFDDKQWKLAEKLNQALLDMHIEGIRGWGQAPGKTMVWKGKLLIPGIQLGNVFLGPQPPRGWELNEELLHANMSFPPPHQYLAFYKYLSKDFGADALVHVGRHSTYEFLPKRGTGLSAADYPSVVAQDIPSIYPYIVDGVGEGIQAKRRGMAVMVDHLTPPLAITQLYDGLLELRQLIESAEAATDQATQQKAIQAMRHKIDVLNLRDELIASMDEELQVRGVGFSDVDDDFLLHEVGHYLTHLQEEFMPLGLHVFGRDWSAESVDVMMNSMAEGDNLQGQSVADIRQALVDSPSAEMAALLNGLNGGYIAPGKGNDPIRTTDALPTGRNFYALDGSLLPSKLGVDIGQKLAEKVRAQHSVSLIKDQPAEKEALILWASDAVRDEGALIAFGLDLLGLRPVWNSRGILKSLDLLPLDEQRAERRDVLFTSSGLFRDLYGAQLELLDQAVLLSLSAGQKTIEHKYPALTLMLKKVLEPVQPLIERIRQNNPQWQQNESLDQNLVARNWVHEAHQLLAQNPSADTTQQIILARQASARIFGTAPGAYGAGINRLVERSGAWDERKQLGQAFIKRMGHVYGVETAGLKNGASAQVLFRNQLKQVGNTYLGRASNLYGLIDNNDAFDYLGGLNLAIETVTGENPDSFVINHANNQNLKMDSLQQALLGELRGRFLNRQWIEPLMKEGYAGARTIGSEFIEYLWGWQVTSPDIIKSWVWEDVKAVYIDDFLEVGLDEFLRDSHNIHVQTNILAVMLVAIEKEFWQTDQKTQQQLAEQFAQNVIDQGIPGSGHTHANHPVYEFVKPLLDASLAVKLESVLAASRLVKQAQANNTIHKIQEINISEVEPSSNQQAQQTSLESDKSAKAVDNQPLLLLVAVVLVLMGIGFFRSARLSNNRHS